MSKFLSQHGLDPSQKEHGFVEFNPDATEAIEWAYERATGPFGEEGIPSAKYLLSVFVGTWERNSTRLRTAFEDLGFSEKLVGDYMHDYRKVKILKPNDVTLLDVVTKALGEPVPSGGRDLFSLAQAILKFPNFLAAFRPRPRTVKGAIVTIESVAYHLDKVSVWEDCIKKGWQIEETARAQRYDGIPPC